MSRSTAVRLALCLSLCALAAPAGASAKGVPFELTISGSITENYRQAGHMQYAPCSPDVERTGTARIDFATQSPQRVLIGVDRGIRGQVEAAVHVERTGADVQTPRENDADACRQPRHADTSGCGARDYTSRIRLPVRGPMSVAIDGDRSLYGVKCPYPPNIPDRIQHDFESPMILWDTEVAKPWRMWAFGGCDARGRDVKPRKRFTLSHRDRLVTPYGHGWEGEHAADVEWTVKFERVGRNPRNPPCSSR